MINNRIYMKENTTTTKNKNKNEKTNYDNIPQNINRLFSFSFFHPYKPLRQTMNLSHWN